MKRSKNRKKDRPPERGAGKLSETNPAMEERPFRQTDY
jgi:hypothetical protein